MSMLRRTIKALVMLSVLASLSCDDSEYVDYNVLVVIPASIRTIDPGVIRLSLWSYDSYMADAPAALIDESRELFSHRGSRQTKLWMRVHGDVGGGSRRHYVTARGFTLTTAGETYVLWDGNLDPAVPRFVTMRYVSPAN